MLCASFQIHWWIQTGITVQKRSITVEIGNILSCVTLKFDGWPWKTIGHLSYSPSSFVHHFIDEFKLVLQSGNVQFGSKSTIFLSEWPWNLTDDLKKTIGHRFHTTLSFVHHFKVMGEFKLKLQSGNVQFGSKSAIFLSCVTFKFDGWPWKTIGHLFYTTSSFVHHFKAMGEFKQELQSGNAQFGLKSAIFCPVWPWNLTDDLEKQ